LIFLPAAPLGLFPLLLTATFLALPFLLALSFLLTGAPVLLTLLSTVLLLTRLSGGTLRLLTVLTLAGSVVALALLGPIAITLLGRPVTE